MLIPLHIQPIRLPRPMLRPVLRAILRAILRRILRPVRRHACRLLHTGRRAGLVIRGPGLTAGRIRCIRRA